MTYARAFLLLFVILVSADASAGLPYTQSACETMGFYWGYGAVSSDPNAVELGCHVPTPDNLPKTFAIAFGLGLGAGFVLGGIAAVLSSLKDMLSGI